ncbi:MAG: hypothetical protein ACE5Q6_08225 [Dehalococcoidia bacterium]
MIDVETYYTTVKVRCACGCGTVVEVDQSDCLLQAFMAAVHPTKLTPWLEQANQGEEWVDEPSEVDSPTA